VDDLELDLPVTTIQFRKPSGRAVLSAALALAQQAGPLVVSNDFDTVLDVSPEDDPAQMAEHRFRLMGSSPTG
jgi:hypothetical protein